MKLYYHPASTTSRSVQMFALDQGIAMDYELVDLFTGAQQLPEYKRINPSSMVPTLVDGDFTLTESSAILKYLADKSNSAAYPKELKARARVNERMDWFNANFNRDFGYGVVYLQVFPHHKRPNEDCHSGTLDWGRNNSARWFKILDENLIGPKNAHVGGDALTIADYLGIEMVAIGDLIGCEFASYPNVQRWIRNMKALKNWGKVHEAINGFAASLKGKSFATV
jgi:glutathione S-transferase